MATPTNLPASFVAGAVLTSTQQNDIRGAFRTLQIIAGSYNVQTASTSATYADTGLTATITPQSTTNKVLISVSIPIGIAGASTIAGFRIVQKIGVTDTTIGTWDYGFGTNSGTGDAYSVWVANVLYSPSTTSAATYRVQFKRTGGANIVYAQTASQTSNIILQEISA